MPDTDYEIKAITDSLSGGTNQELRLTYNVSQAVAQVEASGAELARAGRRFTLGNSAAITGIANVTALPTTAAQWVLWNLSNSVSLFIEEVGVYLTSGTPGAGGILLAAVTPAPATAIVAPTYPGTAIANVNPASSRISVAVVKASATLAVAPCWYPIANNDDSNVGAFPGSGTLENRNVNGRLVIPPRCGLALAVLGLAGSTPLFAPFASWYEVTVPNE